MTRSLSTSETSLENTTLFTAVDRTEDTDFFTRFLDEANNVAVSAGIKPLMLDALRRQPGQFVLDVGCRTGADVIEIAGIVGIDGRVVGVDFSEALIAGPTARVRRCGHR